MEERNLELDDDGKIKLRKNREDFLSQEKEEEDDSIVLEVPDFKDFESEDDRVGLSDEAYAAKAKEREEKAAERKSAAEKLLDEADALFEAGDLVGAGEKYLDSAAEYGADWRPWFGVVRVQTKDFTDFHEIYDCEKAYDRALRRMSKENRAALAERYVPSMESIVSEKRAEAEVLSAKDKAEREESRPALQREYASSLKKAAILTALFVLFAVAGGILAAFISAVPGMQILILAIVCGVAALVLLFVAAWALKRYVSARVALSANGRENTTASGKKAAEAIAYAELVRSVIDDFKAEN